MALRYQLKDWFLDWQSVLEASYTVPKEKENEWIRNFFLSRYQTPAEARWRAERIFAALRYLEKHGSAFEKSGFAIASSKSGTVTTHLVGALYRFFGYMDDSEVNSPPPPKVFIEMAEEDQAHFG